MTTTAQHADTIDNNRQIVNYATNINNQAPESQCQTERQHADTIDNNKRIVHYGKNIDIRARENQTTRKQAHKLAHRCTYTHKYTHKRGNQNTHRRQRVFDEKWSTTTWNKSIQCTITKKGQITEKQNTDEDEIESETHHPSMRLTTVQQNTSQITEN